jgi:hypothetical protein
VGKYRFIGKRSKHLLAETSLLKSLINTCHKTLGQGTVLPDLFGRNFGWRRYIQKVCIARQSPVVASAAEKSNFYNSISCF